MLSHAAAAVGQVLAQHAAALGLTSDSSRTDPQEQDYLMYVAVTNRSLAMLHLLLVPLQTAAILTRNTLLAAPWTSSLSAVSWALPYLAAACFYWARPATFLRRREAVWLWCGWGRVCVKLLMAAGLLPAPVEQMRWFVCRYLDLVSEALVSVTCEMCRLRVLAPLLLAEAASGALMYRFMLQLWPSWGMCGLRALLWCAAVATTTVVCEWRMRAAHARHVALTRSAAHAKVD